MSRTTLGVALALLFLVCLLALAPARLVNAVLPGDTVIMQGYTGTVWRGSANRALVRAGSGYVHLGKVHWSLRPLSLLTLSPWFTVESTWGRQRIKTNVRISGSESLDLTGLDVRFPVKLLRQFLPLAIVGELSVQAEKLHLERGLPSSAEGRVVWRDAAWDSAQGTVLLGSYAMDFSQSPGEALIGKIITIAGPVSADGHAELRGEHYILDVLISSDTGLDTQLEQALSLVAQPVAQGRRIQFDGQL